MTWRLDESSQSINQIAEGNLVVGYLPAFAGWPDGHLERGLGHINPDKDLRLGHHLSFNRAPRADPALHDAGSAAPATVRVVAGRT
jgi:hypothetical protein